MLALRVLCPTDLTPALLEVLRRAPGATHVVRLAGAAIDPPGDVLLADLAREAVSEVLAQLQAVPGGEGCAYTLEAVDTTIS